MNQMIFCIVACVLGLSSAQAIEFTEKEIKAHRENVGTIVQVASACLDETYDNYLDFFDKWGVSEYYGDRRKDYNTLEKRKAVLKSYGVPVEVASQIKPGSCIGLAMKCLKRGFEATGTGATWQKIADHLAIDNKVYGTDLQKDLMKLGWKSYYWNPDPSKNAAWDADDQKVNPPKLPLNDKGEVDTTKPVPWNPVWGGHAYRYNQAVNKGYYYEKDLFVTDATSLVGFKDVQPTFFKEVPFFVGIAHAGYHVFPGRHGEVIEAHSMRDLNDPENMEFSEFNPLKNGGGPKWTPKEKYRSGLIVVPY